ncbi:FGGY-family carbohydrate kinase [Alkalinema pantanalense CENA528]|uniref:FGGY-family carbohydrate kinase n=1 Tax=Alkalinema pantanalense TaxID=1620705 RepID=UPI003D6FB750
MRSSALFLGIDFGTSGARAIAIDATGAIQAQVPLQYPAALPDQPLTDLWQQTLYRLLEQLPISVRSNLAGIAIDGTSSTVLVCDTLGRPISDPILYNDSRAADKVAMLQTLAPPDHTVLSATSSLAKLLWFADQPYFDQARCLLHQADWLSFLLHGQLGISDYHNSLKLGYDVETLAYPSWLETHSLQSLLPQVVAPGQAIGPIRSPLAQRFHIPATCLIHAGTTDSIAAFLASGAQQPGEAVTSLGSTLVLKLLSSTRLEVSRYGIYSHRLGNLWLVGGASNTGGAVLRKLFTDAEIAQLSQQIDPNQPTQYDYYPLLQPGDRFPINDPTLPPRLAPRPASSKEFLQGLLEGIARIETQGYRLLEDLGATPLQQVYTAGGGAKNTTWTQIRAKSLGIPVQAAPYTEAAYGTAKLAAGLGLIPDRAA